MRIIFMPMLPLIESEYKYLGIKYFCEKGYDISILETHQLSLSGYKENVKLDYMDLEYCYTPKNFQDLFDFVKQLSSNDYIFFYLAGKNAVNILKQIKLNTKAKFITFISGSIPQTSTPCGILNILKRKIMPIVRSIQYKFGINTFETDYYITGAPRDELIYPYFLCKTTQHIKIHSRDYDRCLNIGEYKYKTKYCVFLDSDILLSSDYQILGCKFDDKIENYQKKMISFFDWIKISFNIDVIISSHPKSRIYQHLESFRGYKVVHNKSAELVKGSEFVINEGTTAISFAIFFNKPILFFTMQEIAHYYPSVCSFAKELKKDIFNIDNLNDKLSVKMKEDLNNKKKYHNYKYNYLTYKDDNLNSFELIENRIMDKNQ